MIKETLRFNGRYWWLISLVSLVLILGSIGSCSASLNAGFVMSNQNGMTIGDTFPIPVNDYLICNSTSGIGDDPIGGYNWTILNQTAIIYNLNGTESQITFPVTSTGTYYVNLTVYNGSVKSEPLNQSFTVVDSSYSVQANFSNSVNYEVTPPMVTIFDLSQTSKPIFGWWWKVDGNQSGSYESPIIPENLSTGSHLVNLSVAMVDAYENIGVSSISKMIEVSPLRDSAQNILAANFIALSTTGKAPLKVHFLDLSTGRPAAWQWNFGDGITSSEQSPAHTYMRPGTYSVTLQIYNKTAESTSMTKSDYITISKYTIQT